MKDVIVAIKMPESLYDELQRSAREMHYMDLSEEIRSIVRQKWMQYNDPEIMKMKRLKDNIEKELQKKGEMIAREKILGELESIRKKVQGTRGESER